MTRETKQQRIDREYREAMLQLLLAMGRAWKRKQRKSKEPAK